MDKLLEAISRIQAMRDEAEIDRKRIVLCIVHGSNVYLDPWSDKKIEAEYSEEVYEQAWEIGGDSEDHEAYDNTTGAIDALDRGLDLLQALAHGVTPEQGQS